MLFLLADKRPRPRAWARALALGLAAALALILVATAGHHHNARVDTHACAVCALVMHEAPGAEGLPAPVVRVFAQSYLLLCVVAYAGVVRRPLPLPPSCGPPRDPRD
jgi:DNA-binding helix-hairpin-helix protein with protein kinase domain